MNKHQLALLSGGGHARVVLDALLCAGAQVAGIMDPGYEVGHEIFGVRVVGNDDWLESVTPNEYQLVNGAGVVPGSQLRQRLYNNGKQRGFVFATVVHPSAIISREAEILEGAQIMAGAIVQCCTQVGENAVINTGASVDHDCRIGAHAFIGPGAILCGDVRIAQQAFVGAGAVILPGTVVGAGAIIGAGAIVTRDVPEGALMIGNPAMQKKKDDRL